MVALVEPTLAPDPLELLVSRLEDPKIAASLNQLLDHVDLLAVMVVGLDELISRGDTIADSLTEGVQELKDADISKLPDIGELIAMGKQLTGLIGPLQEMLPTLEHLLHSNLVSTQVIDIGSAVSRAAVAGGATARKDQTKISGLRAMLRALKDDDVSRALGFMMAIAKALGQELKKSAPR